MTMICVHQIHTNKPFWVNTDNIYYIRQNRLDDRQTVILGFKFDNSSIKGEYINCVETLEEVMAMVEKNSGKSDKSGILYDQATQEAHLKESLDEVMQVLGPNALLIKNMLS